MQVKLKKEDFQAMAAHAIAHLAGRSLRTTSPAKNPTQNE